MYARVVLAYQNFSFPSAGIIDICHHIHHKLLLFLNVKMQADECQMQLQTWLVVFDRLACNFLQARGISSKACPQ